MSARERKLLIFFGIAGFAILNFLGFNFAQTKRLKVDRDFKDAKQQLANAEKFRESREQITDQMEWLSENEPEPLANQDVQTKLQQFAEKEAIATGLTIKTQKPLPTDSTAGRFYHRAKLEITVTGTEESLYRWFDHLNVPAAFRVASKIRLSPNTQDDTKIDCTTIVEQWFIPPTT